MQAMEDKDVFEYVMRTQVPVGAKIISCCWVYKVKPDKLKSRMVIRGFLQDMNIQSNTENERLQCIPQCNSE